jgi:GNAT superfamily N-acetyltransferase
MARPALDLGSSETKLARRQEWWAEAIPTLQTIDLAMAVARPADDWSVANRIAPSAASQRQKRSRAAGAFSAQDASKCSTGTSRKLCKNPQMQSPHEWAAPAGYVVSTDPVRLDVDRIHRFLSTAYWSAGIPRDIVQRSIANSLPFGLYAPSGEQAGFARVVTDRATYAYLGDVYVETAHRGRGLGKFLVSCVVAHPELQGLRRWALATADAHGLYARHGFIPPASPDIHLFIERAPADLWPPQAEREGTRLRQTTED